MEYRKRTKICLDEPVAAKPPAETVSKVTETASKMVETSKVSAPNTGISSGADFAVLSGAVIFLAIFAAIIWKKAGKSKNVIFSILAILSLSILGFGKNPTFAETSTLENCAKIGYSDYDIVVKFVEKNTGKEVKKVIKKDGLTPEEDSEVVKSIYLENERFTDPMNALVTYERVGNLTEPKEDSEERVYVIEYVTLRDII